ncbi:MAG: hypothetical protein ACUVV0_14485 [Anaerolineae bacterium]
MDVIRPPQKLYPAEIYTSTFKIEGEIEPFGRLIDVLNDPGRSFVIVHRVTISPLYITNPMKPITVPEISLDKRDILFLNLKSREDREEIRLLTNIQRIIAYMPQFILRANFHLGEEVRIRDMMDAMTATFFGITDVTLFPTFSPKTKIPEKHELLLVNKNFIHTYHSERSGG